MLTPDHASWGYTTSTGLAFTHEEIVDPHFDACAAYYRDALDSVGVRPGWHVLDAGCGSGAFLPRIAELVGAEGRISALDLAGESAELAAGRMRDHPARARLEVRQGSVLDLPYADGTFDAVWCANTTQYLDDGELTRALAELRRVTRPGGLVAVKDVDGSLSTVRPADPFLITDFFRASAESPGYARQLLRGRDLYRRLRAAGLTSVRQRTILMEHHAPLTPSALRFYGNACARFARQAMSEGIPGNWAPFLDPDDPAGPLRDPDGYISEGNVIAIGTVPPDLRGGQGRLREFGKQNASAP
ncbi:class I SAM-dependent methyltransferase [Streptomyces jumonjinensis]|uniref:Methyltransferase domain-containing protein n=1 Tax=Streptomyces jumonjinensis TaxID=1945 RepID=A0A646KA29_STRJU|nr:methyltransferase domain-containing protein [Streptomyces jumonjinensis]MQS99062.1 methyltransferase domain-containing protein [Streptomyces jumonjinensis]